MKIKRIPEPTISREEEIADAIQVLKDKSLFTKEVLRVSEEILESYGYTAMEIIFIKATKIDPRKK